MVGVWLVVLASSSILYGKVPRLIAKKTNRLTQAVVLFRNYRQLNTGVGVMCGWCLACCIGVVLNTVRESASPDCKENKQAAAGSRIFSKAFSVRRVFV